MSTSASSDNNNLSENSIDLFSVKAFSALNTQRIIRLSPEDDGLCILYSTTLNNPNKLYSMKILCWGIRADSKVIAVIPWLNKATANNDLTDPDSGFFEGFYDPASERVFYQPPAHKIAELESSVDCFEQSDIDDHDVIQEIPDNIGTHAILNSRHSNRLILTTVLSWRLLGNGHLQAMLIDQLPAEETPVLRGDNSPYRAEQNEDFRYYVQQHIANQIKSEDTDAIAALALLLD